MRFFPSRGSQLYGYGAATKCMLLLLLVLTGCSKAIPDMDHVDLELWKADRNGCRGDRMGMVEEFRSQQDKLLSLQETQVIRMLGRPDRNDLSQGNHLAAVHHS